MQLHPLATWGVGSTRGCTAASTGRGTGCGSQRAAAPARRRRAARRRRGGFRHVGVLLPLRPGHAAVDQRHGAGHRRPGAGPRGARCSARRATAKLAASALGAFETAPPPGVAVPPPRAARATSCTRSRRRCRSSTASCRPSTGCATAAVAGRQPAAPRGSPAPATRRRAASLAGFDTGAWSLYSAAGAESTLSYHQLTTALPRRLCRRTGERSVLRRRAALRALRARAAADRDRAAPTRLLGAARGAAAASRCRRARRSRSGSTARAGS